MPVVVAVAALLTACAPGAADPPAIRSPGAAAPGAAAPGAVAPGLAAPEKAAPEKAAPEKAAPEKAAPEKAAPEKAAPEKAAPEKAAPDTLPERVRIPAIGVDSPLLGLGVAADGSAEVPQDHRLAGWFDGGGRPGGPGPTVLLGHVDSRIGPAVFYRLRELGPGAVVEVLGDDGSLARYAVERTEQVPKGGFPTFAVFGAAPDDVLRLITCAGEFDRGARSYTDNLVVHARRI